MNPGELVDEKYRVIRLLGSGGMGVVYEAEHVHVGRRVALKVLRTAADSEQVARFRREARAASQVESRHIVQVFDLGRLPDGAPFMVMEYLEGETLGQRAARSRTLTPGELVPIALQILDALRAAHRAGIVHRDLKPENVFLVGEPGTASPNVKVLDFGISKFQDEGADLTRSGMILGTPQYMSPEQARGARHADARTDLYALGAILYRCVTGHAPHGTGDYGEVLSRVLTVEPTPVSELVPELDPGFGAIVTRAMATKPAHRYQSAGELERELCGWSERHGGVQPGESPAPTGSSWSSGARPIAQRRRRTRALILVATTVLAGAVTAVAGVATRWRTGASPLAEAPPLASSAVESASAVLPVADESSASAAPPIPAESTAAAVPEARGAPAVSARRVSRRRDHETAGPSRPTQGHPVVKPPSPEDHEGRTLGGFGD